MNVGDTIEMTIRNITRGRNGNTYITLQNYDFFRGMVTVMLKEMPRGEMGSTFPKKEKKRTFGDLKKKYEGP